MSVFGIVRAPSFTSGPGQVRPQSKCFTFLFGKVGVTVLLTFLPVGLDVDSWRTSRSVLRGGGGGSEGCLDGVMQGCRGAAPEVGSPSRCARLLCQPFFSRLQISVLGHTLFIPSFIEMRRLALRQQLAPGHPVSGRADGAQTWVCKALTRAVSNMSWVFLNCDKNM